MNDLLKLAIEAHGGLDRWRPIDQVSAKFVPGGVGFKQRGQEEFTRKPTRVTVSTRQQHTVLAPFLADGVCGVFKPARTTIETSEGTVLDELKHPRDSFRCMPMGAPWSALQLAYFAGYAMSMYLIMPFLLLNDGINCEEVKPWAEDGETWRALKVSFPDSFVTHSRSQTIYFDEKGLMRRHDYTAEVSNDAQVAHYLYDHCTCDGIVFPTRRRVYLRGPDLKPQKDLVVISADLSDFDLLSAAL